jgi:ArsR family transcriptional regulator, arsenate/arsenite/antimonite-responsive transcriptional repressor
MEFMMKLTKIIKALADENRLRILNLLGKKEMCVCEIEQILEINQSNASRHLIKLSDADIIDSEKQGQYVFYRINPSIIDEYPFLKVFLEQELNKLTKCKADIIALDKLEKKGMLCRRGSCCLEK